MIVPSNSESCENDESVIDLRRTNPSLANVDYFGQSKIPKILFQTWGTSKFRKSEILELLSLRDALEGAQFVFHNDDDMFEYMSEKWSRHPIYSVFLSVKSGAARADIWRYCILYEYGGVYLDIDSSFHPTLISHIGPDFGELFSFESNPITYKHKYLVKTIKRINTTDRSLPIPMHLNLQWLFFCKPKHVVLEIAIRLISQRFLNLGIIRNIDQELESDATSFVLNLTGPAVFSEAVLISRCLGHTLRFMQTDFGGFGKFKSATASAYFYRSTASKHYSQISTSRQIEQGDRLNIGCGTDIRLGFINIDSNPLHADVSEVDINNYSFENNRFSLVYMRDVLEHLSYPSGIRLLGRVAASIKEGGILIIQTTSIDVLREYLCIQQGIDIATINYLLFAGVSWSTGVAKWDTQEVKQHDWHKSIYTLESITRVLNQLGLQVTFSRADMPMIITGSPSHKQLVSLNMKLWAIRTNK